MRHVILALLVGLAVFTSCSDDDTQTDNTIPEFSSPEISGANITFRYGMVGSPSIYLAGNFNSWAPNNASYLLTKISNNLWGITLSTNDIKPGDQYKFYCNGNWLLDSKNSFAAIDGFGGTNSLIAYGPDIAEYTNTTVSPEIASSTVIFRIRGTRANAIYLAGSFNGFSSDNSSYQLTNNGFNLYTLEVDKTTATNGSLYKFVFDGTWITDPANSNRVGDGFGGYNSQLVY